MSVVTNILVTGLTDGSGGGGVAAFSDSGIATLSSGTVTVSSAEVNSSSEVFLTYKSTSGVQGVLSVGTIVDGVSFVIESSSESDNSTVTWGVV